MKRLALKTTMLAVAFALSGPTLAWNEGGGEQDEALHLTPDLENGRDVYEVCSACHLPEGWGLEDGTYPQIAGQHASVLVKQLADIRALNRNNPTMYPFALEQAIGGPQALADVVAYTEKLPMNPNWGKGLWGPDTPEYAAGKKLYQDNCVKCHGDEGLGDAEKYYPRINGQHYKYMVRQFEWIRDGRRRNANPDMMKQIAGFSDEQMQRVVNYVSWVPVPEKDLAPSTDWKNPDFE